MKRRFWDWGYGKRFGGTVVVAPNVWGLKVGFQYNTFDDDRFVEFNLIVLCVRLTMMYTFTEGRN